MTAKTYPTQLHTTYKVETHDVDFHQEIKVPELMNLLQDLATQHADLLDFGYDFLLQKQQFWVLSRLRIEIAELPKWKQTIQCRTWTNGLDGIFPLRNWQLFFNNRLIIAGYAQWLILDGKTHRPTRPDMQDFAGKTHDEMATNSPIKKLKPFAEAQKLEEFKIRIHELDMNAHVNNVYYFAWIMDSLGLDFQRNYQPCVIDINYLKEVTFPGMISVMANPEKTRFMLVSNNGETLHCLINIEWKKREPEQG